GPRPRARLVEYRQAVPRALDEGAGRLGGAGRAPEKRGTALCAPVARAAPPAAPGAPATGAEPAEPAAPRGAAGRAAPLESLGAGGRLRRGRFPRRIAGRAGVHPIALTPGPGRSVRGCDLYTVGFSRNRAGAM